MKKSIQLVIAGVAVGGALGSGAVRMLDDYFHERDTSKAQIRQGQYKFINPLLECELGYLISEKKFSPFRKEIESFVSLEKEKGNLSDYAIYYRDLNNGPWFGINEKETFIPASLLKLPLALTFYKEVEKDPELLKEGIVYDGSISKIEQHYKPEQNLKIGESYLLKDLVSRMLKYSDNEAALIVADVLGLDKIKQTYADMALPQPENANYSISVKNYATFLRVLYNASYLNHDDSDLVLSLISNTTFNRGIKRGIPNDVEVVHKFGEVIGTDIVGYNQLHDCGIIYNKTSPYLLCIMTRGKDFEKLDEIISSISKIIYERVKVSE